MLKFRKSLKNVLTLNFILVAVIPILVIGLASLSLLTQNLSSEIRTKNLSLAKSLSSEVDMFLSHPVATLKMVVDIVDKDQLVSQKSINNFLESIVRNHNLFDMVQILDSHGNIKFIAPFNGEFSNINMSHFPFYDATLKTKSHFWSQTFISMQTGLPTLTVSVPMSQGMVVGYLNLNILTTISDKVEIGQNGYAIIADQEGNVLSHPIYKNVSEQRNIKNLKIVREGLAGNEGTYLDMLDHNQVIGSISIIPQTKWLVIIIQKYSEAFAPVIKIKIMLFWSVVLTAALAIFIAIKSLQKTLLPFSYLITSVKHVTNSNYDAAESIPLSYDEINELSHSFEIMTNAVKDRQQSLQESERLYRSLIETLPYGIQENNLEGIITFTNPAYEKIMECHSGDLIGERIWDLKKSESSKIEQQKYLEKIIEYQPPPTPYFTQIKTKKGNIVDIQIDWNYKRDNDQILLGFISIITDITDQKILEENLRQAQKMEAIGTLTGGIAHDFNNILTAILGYTELVQCDLKPDSEQWKDLDSVIRAANRAKDLVKHMLTFSRKSEHQKMPMKVSLVMIEALKLLRASIPTTIEIIQDIDENSGYIFADPTQIHQVLMNLCTNASHSMENHGGILEVTLKVVKLSENDILLNPDLKPGQYLEICVRDSGTGISPDVLNRIFDPFFTTKDTGRGTGMGLSVVHGIVKNHRAMIKVDSKLGVGTRFYVYFKKIQKNTPQIIKNTSNHLPSGNERILVVDDEITLTKMIKTVLVRLGYNVTTKTNSLEALSLFYSQPDNFDLIITDQTMPQMTGRELTIKILACRPDIPVILSTGFSSTINQEKAMNIGAKAFFMKPFENKELAIIVRKVLDDTNKNHSKTIISSSE